jgi:hypothetical protein
MACWLTALIFFLSFLFWEFFIPFNQFGEPLLLLALQMFFWMTIAGAEGLVIAAVFESKLSGWAK